MAKISPTWLSSINTHRAAVCSCLCSTNAPQNRPWRAEWLSSLAQGAFLVQRCRCHGEKKALCRGPEVQGSEKGNACRILGNVCQLCCPRCRDDNVIPAGTWTFRHSRGPSLGKRNKKNSSYTLSETQDLRRHGRVLCRKQATANEGPSGLSFLWSSWQTHVCSEAKKWSFSGGKNWEPAHPV